MAKIMLVEDDNNLREIYQARLEAEGFEIIGAADGEEALALAVKEKPDLIISDIMMPKISGFDMLDILRSTPETKDTKIIMMTALSQAEDKARASKLGADFYLVKSQVTLEDVARVAKEAISPEGIQQTESGEIAPSETETTLEPSQPETPSEEESPAVIENTDQQDNNKSEESPDKNTPEQTNATVASEPVVDQQTAITQPDDTADNPVVQETTQEVPITETSDIQSSEEQKPQENIEYVANNPTLPTSPQVQPEPTVVTPTNQEVQSDTAMSPVSQTIPVAEPPVDNTEPTTNPPTENNLETQQSTDDMMKNAVDNLMNSDKSSTGQEDASTQNTMQNSANLTNSTSSSSTSSESMTHKKVIQPLSDFTEEKPNLDELLAKEDAKQQVIDSSENSQSTQIPISSDDQMPTQTSDPGSVAL